MCIYQVYQYAKGRSQRGRLYQPMCTRGLFFIVWLAYLLFIYILYSMSTLEDFVLRAFILYQLGKMWCDVFGSPLSPSELHLV